MAKSIYAPVAYQFSIISIGLHAVHSLIGSVVKYTLGGLRIIVGLSL